MALDFQPLKADTLDFQPEKTGLDFQPDEVANAYSRIKPQMELDKLLEGEPRIPLSPGDTSTPSEDAALLQRQKDLKTLAIAEAKHRATGEADTQDVMPTPDQFNRAMFKRTIDYIPLKGSTQAAEEGIKAGMDVAGNGLAGQAAGTALGGIGVVGTAFNPLTAAAQDVAKRAQAYGAMAGGDNASAAKTLMGLEEILPNLKPEMTEDWKRNMLSDFYVMARKDPVNTALIVDGLAKMGASGFAARAGRLGRPLPEFLSKNFPETTKPYADAYRKFNEPIGPMPTGEGMKIGPQPEPQVNAAINAGVEPIEAIKGQELPTAEAVAEPKPTINFTPEPAQATTEPTPAPAEPQPAAQPQPKPEQVRMNPVDAHEFSNWARTKSTSELRQLRDDHEADPMRTSDHAIELINAAIKEKADASGITMTTGSSKAEAPMLGGKPLDFDPVRRETDLLDEPQPTIPGEPARGGPVSGLPDRGPVSEPIGDSVGDGTSSTEALRERGARIGVTVSEGEPEGKIQPVGGVTRVTPEGDVHIVLSSLLDKETAKMPGGEQVAGAVRRHELIHSGLLKAWVDEWKAQGGLKGTGVTAKEFWRQKHAEIFSDIKNSISQWESLGKGDVASRIKTALYNSWNVYKGERFGKLGAREWAQKQLDEAKAGNTNLAPADIANLEKAVKIATPDDLLSHLSDNPSDAAPMLSEFIRHLQEIKEKDVTSDLGYRALMGKLMNWMKDALGSLRVAAREVKEGVYGEKIRDALRATDEMMLKADSEGTIQLTTPEKGAIFNDHIELGFDDTKYHDFNSPEAIAAGKAQMEAGKPKPEPTKVKPSKFSFLTKGKLTPEQRGKAVADSVIRDIHNENVVDSITKRTIRGWGFVREAAVETLRKAGGIAEVLGDRISRYYDDRASLLGDLASRAQRVLDKIPRKELTKAYSDFEEYMRIREGAESTDKNFSLMNPRERAAAAQAIKNDHAGAAEFYKTMSPHARALVDVVGEVFKYTGQVNDLVGVMNKDPMTGEYRKIGDYGKDYWPKVLNEEVKNVLENPAKHPEEFRKLMTEVMKKNGLVTIEQAKLFLARTRALENQNASKLGNLEFSRTNYLPNSFYEHRFEHVFPTFMARWSDRIAQIKHFGQNLEGTEWTDAFANALKRTTDKTTQQYIKDIRSAIYGNEHNLRTEVMARMRAYTTLTKLSSVWTAFKNLSTVFINTAPEFGILPASKAAIQTLFKWGERVRQAQEAGALKTDLVNAYAEVWDLNAAQRKVTQFGLDYSGFSLTEKFTRAHAAMTGISWARWALDQIENNPNSRAALTAKAKFAKYKINPDILKAEGFDGPQAKKLMRAASTITQFDYDLRQIPLWMETPTAKWLFQFQKFGVQALNRLDNDVIRPALVGHKVQDASGKTVTVRDYRPLFYTMAATVGTGEGLLALRSALLGKDRNDASLTEIASTATNDKRSDLALFYLAQRLAHDAIYAGTWGSLGDWSGNFEDFMNRGKTRSLIDPPGMTPLKNFWDNIVMSGIQQKKLTAFDLKTFIKNELPLLNYSESLWKVATGNEEYDAQRRLQRIRQLGYRYLKETQLPLFAQSMEFGKTVHTADYRDLQNALMTGDEKTAKEIRDRLVGEAKTYDQKKKVLQGMKASVSARSPFKVGAVDAQNEKADFKAWMLRRVGIDEWKDLRKLDETYQQTAFKVGLKNDVRIGTLEGAQLHNDIRLNRLNRTIASGD